LDGLLTPLTYQKSEGKAIKESQKEIWQGVEQWPNLRRTHPVVPLFPREGREISAKHLLLLEREGDEIDEGMSWAVAK
jgi:hypothetical protein